MDSDKTIIRPRPGQRSAAPAADADVTVIRPRPGGRRAPEQPEPDRDATVVRGRKPVPRGPLVLREAPAFQNSRLVEAGSTLLSLTTQLRQVQSVVDVNVLHQQAVQSVQTFQRRAATSGLDARTSEKASYLLCSLVDEAVLNTLWGEHSSWSQKSLLRVFHQETYGGERVFGMIDEDLGAARKDYEFLELAYVALSLGFEGKYRIDSQGRVKLEQIRNDIYLVLHTARDRFKKELSGPIGTAGNARPRLHSFLPVWVFAAVLAVLAFGVYTYLLLDLNKTSDKLLADLAALVPPPVEAQLPEHRVHPEVLRLRELLAPEVDRGVLAVEQYQNRVSVVLQAEELFDSGSTAIDAAFHPVLDKIAKALEALPGRATVTGHTDNVAIRTPRFPSNWHLSLARASEVVKYMAGAGDLSGRLLPEGRADTEPVAANDTPEGRARNRRVTIDVALTGS